MKKKSPLLSKGKVFLVFFFLIIAFIFTLPIFKNINNWGLVDWDLDTFYYAVPRTIILKYRQFPLWNPYYCGGMPLLANPQSKFLSPFFLIILLFGEIIGIKILIFLHSLIGLFGVYYLARHYKLNKSASCISSFVYMLSSMYSLPVTAGMTTFMLMAYIPWIFLYYLKSFSNIKYSLLSILFLLLMLFSGGIQLLSITLTFIAVYSFFLVVLKKQPLIKTTKLLTVILLLTLLLGSIKLFPAIELINQYPREIKDYSGYSLNSLQYSLFNRDQSITAENKFPFRAYGFLNGISSGMDENGMYIGLIPFILFLLGIGLYFKPQLALVLCFIIFLWLSFGHRVPVRALRLWGMLRKLPFYKTMRIAQRFRFVFMLCLSIFSGLGFQAVKTYLNKKIKKKALIQVFTLSLIAFILIDLMAVNSLIFKNAFPVSPFKLKKSKTFYQIWKNPKYDKSGFSNSSQLSWYRSRSSMYPTLLTNVGTICCYEPMAVPRDAIPKEDERYQGEVFLKGTEGKVDIIKWSPNKVVININALSEGYLVLNQNYYPGWKVKGAKNNQVESIDKLLGVKVAPLDKQIEFYYLPTSFIIGLIISLATVSFLFIILKRKK